MQYLGGKSRVSTQISEVINAISGWQIKNSETNSRNDILQLYHERERERERVIRYS